MNSVPSVPQGQPLSSAGGTGAGSSSSNNQGQEGKSGAAASSAATSSSAATTGTTPAAGKITPKDGQVIAAIMKDMGIDYEPKVLHQLLEFSYSYATRVLTDALLYSNYAGKKVVDLNDVKLSIEKLSDKMFTSPPPRDLLMELSRHKNSVPLPPIKSHAGPRLPPDRYSLISCNYKSRRGIKTTTNRPKI
jgi:histone H3/H4